MLGLGTLGGLPLGGTPPLIILLHPGTDISEGGWTDQLGSTVNIYQAIDELVVDDSDYIQSPLQDVRIRSDLVVRLFEGSKFIAEWTHTDIPDTFVDATQTLTQPQFDSITEFFNLIVELDDNLGNVYRFALTGPPPGFNPTVPATISYRYKKASV